MDEPAKTILIIDDDREIASTIQTVLTHAGYRVFLAINGVEGQKQIESLKPDLVITDMMMPRMGGFPVLDLAVSEVKPNAPVAIEVPAPPRRESEG